MAQLKWHWIAPKLMMDIKQGEHLLFPKLKPVLFINNVYVLTRLGIHHCCQENILFQSNTITLTSLVRHIKSTVQVCIFKIGQYSVDRRNKNVLKWFVILGKKLVDEGSLESTNVSVQTVAKHSKGNKSGPALPVFNADPSKVTIKGMGMQMHSRTSAFIIPIFTNYYYFLIFIQVLRKHL